MKNFPLHAQLNSSSNTYLWEIIQTQSFTKLPDHIPQFYVLQLASGSRISELERYGFEFVKSLGEDHVIVRALPREMQRRNSVVLASYRANNKWKAHPKILEMEPDATGEFVLRTTSASDVVDRLVRFHNVDVKQLSADLVRVSTTAEIVTDILNLEEVIYAGIESFTPRAESRVLDLYLSPNTVNKIHNDYPSLNGEGMTVSIKDQLFDSGDIDLQGRYKSSSLSAEVLSGHATDMATIVAGAGNSFINGRGVAPAAYIASSDFQNLLPDESSDFVALDAWVQNHSYGTVIENFYGTLAEGYDAAVVDVPEVFHVFSSGNQGFATPTDGAYAGVTGFGNHTGNFKMAKNILTVGSVDTLGNVLSFSSRGPAYDGRVKPELVAYSTQGSSNSAALVSGVALLLQQAYKEIHDQIPSSALLKALLINSAKDAGPPGLDYTAGYGSVDAHRSLENLLVGNFFSGDVTNGEQHTFQINLPAGAKNLKVTLVWNDAPATPGSAIALVNDVDLKVVNGNTWLPWVLDHTADVDKLSLPATRNKDQLNTIEQVTLADPAPGVYQIQVEGYDVPEGPQPFYVVYQWDPGEAFTWTFPTANDNFPYDGETGTYFYWRSTLSDQSGKFEYTLDDGTTWHVIDESVDLRPGQYRWVGVPGVAAVARVRCITNAGVFETESFTISRPVIPSIGFNCEDSVMLQWTNLSKAESYQIFKMDDVSTFVEPIAVLSDTFLILEKNVAASRFAIQPVVNGRSMLRSPLFDYNDLGTVCYIVSVLSEVDPTQGIFLTLRLGTLYGVASVTLQHERDGIFETIDESLPATNVIQFLDEHPSQGLNQYRVVVHFTNGQESSSDIIEEYYLTTLPFVVFPNPVSSGGELTIFSKLFDRQDVIFRLYKSDGSLAQATALLSDREAVTLENIVPGLYLYTITSPDGVFNGRIVVK